MLPDAPEEFPEAAASAAPGQLTAAAVREVWPEIITAVGRQSKKVAALASVEQEQHVVLVGPARGLPARHHLDDRDQQDRPVISVRHGWSRYLAAPRRMCPCVSGAGR